MDYEFDQIIAADPATPGNVAAYASVLIFAPGDESRTPLPLKKPNGASLANPVPTNGIGYGSAFIAQMGRVAWAGGELTGFFYSAKGFAEASEASRVAAEAAQGSAALAAAAAQSAQAAAEAASAGGGGGVTGGSVQYARKTGGAWPTRPTASPDVVVLWIGADPSPAIVGSGTGGMLNGDVRWITT